MKITNKFSKLKVFKSLRYKISRSIQPKFNAMVSVKRYQPGHDFLNRIIYALGGKITPNYSKLNRMFLNKLHLLWAAGGIPMVVKYLKVTAICLQQVGAGHVLTDLTPLGMRISRDKTGLPRIIPAYQRKLLRQGNAVVHKYWLTLSSLYRDLHFSGVLKLGTITKESSALSSDILRISSLITLFVTLYHDSDPREALKVSNTLRPILKSGPQVSRKDNLEEHNTHPSSVRRSFYLYHNSWEGIELRKSLTYIMNSLQLTEVISLWDHCKRLKWDKVIPSTLILHDFLGKLSTKEEAAGKVRLFAMVDAWTQWVLRPIHKYLESILRSMPTDGTFNQLAPLSRVPWGLKPIYSFDLSAATDRLPMALQVIIISVLFGEEFANHWKALLVNRRYKVPKPGFGDTWILPAGSPKFVKYQTGQPMGAYSSWVMLAYTHHYLVHYCAWVTGTVPKGTKFSDYAVLGDDIVIWNKNVADEYLKVMSLLGVEVGLAKSVISPKGKGLEFAKKTLILGTDVSPVPFKEQVSAVSSAYAFRDFIDKYQLSPLAALRFLGFGYKVDPTKDNMINHVMRIIRMMPKTGADLAKLFVFNSTFLDLYPTTIPKHDLLKVQLETYMEELQTIRKKSSDYYWKLLTSLVSLEVDSSPIWGDPSNVVVEKVWKNSITKTLQDLQAIKASSTAHINSISWSHSVVRAPTWGPEWYSLYQLSPQKNQSISSFIVRSWTDLSALKIDSMTRPVPIFDNSRSSGMEAKTTLRKWNHWSRRLNNIHSTTNFIKF